MTYVEPPPGPTTTLSTRLSSEQKELIEQAAQLQSWTASNLIRKAAIERAAHATSSDAFINRIGRRILESDTLSTRLIAFGASKDLWRRHGGALQAHVDALQSVGVRVGVVRVAQPDVHGGVEAHREIATYLGTSNICGVR